MTATEDYEAAYPADVRSAALKVMTAEPRRRFVSWELCDAILAERQRCADIARNSVMVAKFDGVDQAAAHRVNRACNQLAKHIAAKIGGGE